MPWVLGLLARDLAWRVARAAAWALAGAVILLSGCTVIGGGGLLIAGQVQVVAPGAAQPTPTLPSGNPIVPAPPTPTLAPAPPPSDRVEAVIAAAMTWRGVPYLWGGCTRRGVDCSCFVQNALGTVGIHAPRVTWQQIAWTTPISRAELRRGDLVYFDNTCTDCGPNPTHVGLALGNGLMIQAGGSQVSVQPIFAGYYGAHFGSAGRVPGL